MNERAIFLAALERETPAERSDWLDEACGGDEALRRRVEALLRAYDDAGSFLERPPSELEPSPTVLHENGAPSGAAPGERTVLTGLVGDDEGGLDFLDPPRSPGHLGALGPYEITDLVGRGGMGVVLKGQDVRLHRVAAIKVLAPELASNAAARKRFLREAQAAAAVSHDHVVTIYGIDEANGLPYLAMEYVAGQSLQQRIDCCGPLEVKEILRVGRQTAQGLAAAHEQGLIHRDIKPANILLENGIQRVKITDFGLARAVDDVSLTQTGLVAGTPQYMSPEQAQGLHVDHRSDLFSLGCVLYAMCTGRPPFRADSTLAVLRRICDDAPRPISQVNPEIPHWLASAIDRLLAKDPAGRFQSAQEVAEVLGRCLAHAQQPSAVPVPELDWSRGTQPGAASGGPAPSGAEFDAGASGLMERLGRDRRWRTAVAAVLLVGASLGLAEAMGVTDVVPTVIRVVTGQGTLVVEIDDPAVSVRIDDGDLVVTGAGVHELRVQPGLREVAINRGGLGGTEMQRITVERGGRRILRVQPADAVVENPHGRSTIDGETGRASPVVAVTSAARQFEPHRGPCYQVKFSPDGRLAVSAGADETVRVWDIASGREVRRFDGHRLDLDRRRTLGAWGVTSAVFSPDGRQVLSGGWDGVARVWDVEMGGEVLRLTDHEGTVTQAVFSPDGRTIATAAAIWTERSERFVRLWDAATGREIRQLDGLQLDVMDVAFSRDGRQLVSTSGNGIACVWDVNTGQERHRFVHPTGVRRADFSPDGRVLATTGTGRRVVDGRLDDPENCVVRLWDLETGRLIHTLIGHTGSVRSVAFSPDGGLVLSSSGGEHVDGRDMTPARDASVRLWDAQTGRELCRFVSEQPVTIHHAAFSPDGRTVLSCDEAGVVRLWEVPADILLRPSATASSGDQAVAGRPFSGRPSAVTGTDSPRETRRFEGSHTKPLTSVAVLPEERLLSGSFDGTVRLWELATGREIRAFLGGDLSAVNAVAVSPDGRFAVCGRSDGHVALWDVQTGQPVRDFAGHTGHVRAAAFSPDGRVLATGSARQPRAGDADSGVRLWDVESGRELRRLEGIDQLVNALAWSPDGGHVLVGGTGRMLGLWDAATGESVHMFSSGRGDVLSVAVSPDGRRALSGQSLADASSFEDGKFLDPDNVACLWDVESGALVRILKGHTGPVNSVAFSPDGRFLLTASGGAFHREGYSQAFDNSLRLWDAETGDELWQAEAGCRIAGAAVTADGRFVISAGGELAGYGGNDQPDLRLWRLPEELHAGEQKRPFEPERSR